MRNRLYSAFVLAVTSALANCSSSKSSPTEPALPASIHSCETNTATLCTIWVLSDGKYVADWSQGSHAVITVNHFGSDYIEFIRNDPSGTSAGMFAVYRGIPSGHMIQQGTVTWTYQEQTFSGVWGASW